MTPVYVTYQITKTEHFNLKPTTTILELKQAFPDSHIRLVFGDGKELSPIVFTSNNYDNLDFSHNNLTGAKLYVTKNISNVYYVLQDEENKVLSVSPDRDKLIEYFLLNYIKDTGFQNVDELIEQYGQEGPFNFNNPAHKKALEDEMWERHYEIREIKMI